MDGRWWSSRATSAISCGLLTANDAVGAGQQLPRRLAAARARCRRSRTGSAASTWRAASKRNVAHHYDLSDRLYDLFLDADRQYSCAYFTDPAEQPRAGAGRQEGAYRRQARAQAGHERARHRLRLGRDGAVPAPRRPAPRCSASRCREEQIKVARARAEAAGVADKVTFELIDYRHVTGTFDRIVSVGMFEHVGPPHYRTFFRKCRDLLTAGRRDAAPHDRPRRRAGRHRRIHRQIHLSRRLHPGAVGDRRAANEGLRCHRRPISRCCGCITPTRSSTGTTRTVAATRRDRRAVRRTLLPDVDLLSRRRVRRRSAMAAWSTTSCNSRATATRCRSRAIIWWRRSARAAMRLRHAGRDPASIASASGTAPSATVPRRERRVTSIGCGPLPRLHRPVRRGAFVGVDLAVMIAVVQVEHLAPGAPGLRRG